MSWSVEYGGAGMWRKFHISQAKVLLPNANTLGYSKYEAEPGDFIAWQDDIDNTKIDYGRVMGRVSSCDNDGDSLIGQLAVMWFHTGTFGTCSLRIINPEHVCECRTFNPGNFIKAMFDFDMTPANIKLLYQMEKHGSLSDSYFPRNGIENWHKCK